ncbi:unnamed protein product [Ectocarpus sp. CCAP 1310/34]|nr:unnamed protein product [Ectocarpus sp. CCAP 1310/34]
MTFVNLQGLGIHVNTCAGANMLHGVRLQRMLGNNTKGDVLPWERAGPGRCWHVKIDGTTGAASFVLQRKHLPHINLESHGFTAVKSKETRGAAKRTRYDSRFKAHVVNQLRILQEDPKALFEDEHLAPQQYLETYMKIDHSLIRK